MTWRKLFHWGIVFWLLVWLGSVFFYETFTVGLKGSDRIEIVFGSGSLGISCSGKAKSLPKYIAWHHSEIWTPDRLNRILNHPVEYLTTNLGRFGIRMRGHNNGLLFPLAGFLWLWLAAGLCGEMHLLKHPVRLPEEAPVTLVGSRKRILVVVAFMIVIATIIGGVHFVSYRTAVAAKCAENIRRIEGAIEGYGIGERIEWKEILADLHSYNPKRRNCPCGQAYILSPVKPPAGKDAVRCPREDHRRYRAGVSGP